jgi:hypothetical protein
MYDKYQGQPHYLWAFLSKHLEKATRELYSNLMRGLKFVMGEADDE